MTPEINEIAMRRSPMSDAIDLRQVEEVDRHYRKLLIDEIVDDENDFTLTKIEINEKAIERLDKQVSALENFVCGLRGGEHAESTKKDKPKRSLVCSLTSIPNELNELSIRLFDLCTELGNVLVVREEIADFGEVDDIPPFE
jgi:hypothetical protein